MNMEKRAQLHELRHPQQAGEPIIYQQIVNDEINLGDLLRSLFAEWKLLALVMAVGILLALAAASYLSRSYLVEAVLRVPTVNEMGELSEQDIVQVSPQAALEDVVEQLVAADVVQDTIVGNDWLQEVMDQQGVSASSIAMGILDDLSVVRIKHDYYELEKGEKAPFRNIRVSLPSAEPEEAAGFVQSLIENAHARALAGFSSDVSRVKNNRIQSIEEKLNALALAARQSREAQIKRIEEQNRQAIAALQLQIAVKLEQARQDRENQITRLQEALQTAERLGIEEPVTWDDLRPLRKSTQVINELGAGKDSSPDYFRGTRLLAAELARLQQRQDDRPFVGGLTELEKQIVEIENDPQLAALKARPDDTIYVEQFDDLQRQLTNLLKQPTHFVNGQMAVVTQPAEAASAPIRNPLMIFVAGVFLSGLLALFVAMIRIALRNSAPAQGDGTVAAS
jgi:LPS O-antigen subunit length determinant protein (WzzB/FepE family)